MYNMSYGFEIYSKVVSKGDRRQLVNVYLNVYPQELLLVSKVINKMVFENISKVVSKGDIRVSVHYLYTQYIRMYI